MMRLLVVFCLVALFFMPVADAWVYRAIGAPPKLGYDDIMTLPRAVPAFSPLTGFAAAAPEGIGPLQLDFHPLAKGTPPVKQIQAGTQLYGELVLKKKGAKAGPITPNDDVMIYVMEVGQNRPRMSQATVRAPQTVFTNLYGNKFHGKLVDGVIPSNEILYDIKDEAWYFRVNAADTDSVQQFFVFVEYAGMTRYHGTSIYAT